MFSSEVEMTINVLTHREQSLLIQLSPVELSSFDTNKSAVCDEKSKPGMK